MSEIYLGNPNLKKANTQIEWTEDKIVEFLKCKSDPVYFARNYIKIVSLDHGLVPFDMYPFQEKLIQNFHDQRFNICKICLLYTSPSPRDATLSRMPSSA